MATQHLSDPSPADHEPDLASLLERVERLKEQSHRLPRPAAPAPWATATGGKEIKPGLVLAVRRFHLGYRHEGRALADILRGESGGSLPLSAAPDLEKLGLLSLAPALLDDGSPRLFLAGWARLEEDQFVIRQALALRPGAEAALVEWLETETRSAAALLTAAGRRHEQPLLAAARLRHGMAGTAPTCVDLMPVLRRRGIDPALPGDSTRVPAWRALQSATPARIADLLKRQRKGLLDLVAGVGAV